MCRIMLSIIKIKNRNVDVYEADNGVTKVTDSYNYNNFE